mmetsp:Transcript_60849/g.96402  ORF Transcript_60849/g.96402 Transcript_60849/m.96402 type:complete len:262 (+) Transcript_60849:385-1170(+)
MACPSSSGEAIPNEPTYVELLGALVSPPSPAPFAEMPPAAMLGGGAGGGGGARRRPPRLRPTERSSGASESPKVASAGFEVSANDLGLRPRGRPSPKSGGGAASSGGGTGGGAISESKRPSNIGCSGFSLGELPFNIPCKPLPEANRGLAVFPASSSKTRSWRFFCSMPRCRAISSSSALTWVPGARAVPLAELLASLSGHAEDMDDCPWSAVPVSPAFLALDAAGRAPLSVPAAGCTEAPPASSLLAMVSSNRFCVRYCF